MGFFHRHDYQPARTDTEINRAFVKETKVVKCSRCPKEGVSGVQTRLNPKFRNEIIDNQ